MIIPVFNLLKEPFEGVHKNLVTDVKEMKNVFKSMEDDEDQNLINVRSGEIERKNLLIDNDNLITICISIL